MKIAKPLQARAHRTRNNILKAGVKLFAEKGFLGTSVNEIAFAAGNINKQRIYAYFGSKEHLFEEVLLHVFAEVELFSQKTLVAAEAHPEQLTQLLLEGFMAVHANHGEFWRLLGWATLEKAVDPALIAEVRTPENKAIRAVFEHAKEMGYVCDIDFESYLFTLLAVSYFFHSNAMTLSHTLSSTLFKEEGKERLIADLCSVFRK